MTDLRQRQTTYIACVIIIETVYFGVYFIEVVVLQEFSILDSLYKS